MTGKMTGYKIIIDHELCWGCKACEVACKQENKAPTGIKLIAVSEDGPHRIDGELAFSFHVDLCRHCDDASCVDICPEEAIGKRDDGIVVMHADPCTGCESCMAVCPFDAIGFDGQMEIARKCNLCHHRVDKGLIPACADNVCPAHCIYFEQID